MKYYNFLVLSSLLIGTHAFSSACPDLSGKWGDSANPANFVTIQQMGCSEIIMKVGDFSADRMIDGVARRTNEPSNPDNQIWTIKLQFVDGALVVDYSSTTIQSGVTDVSFNKEVYRLQNNGRALVKDWSSYDNAGNMTQQMQGTYARIP